MGFRTAAIQSLLSAKWLGALAWLSSTLERLPTLSYSRIDELLPLRSLEDEQIWLEDAR